MEARLEDGWVGGGWWVGCHLFEGVPTDLPRADELLLPMYSFFLRSIVPRTLNELKNTIDFDLIKCLFSPDLASLVVGAPDLATDPRTRRNRLLRRLWSNIVSF